MQSAATSLLRGGLEKILWRNLVNETFGTEEVTIFLPASLVSFLVGSKTSVTPFLYCKNLLSLLFYVLMNVEFEFRPSSMSLMRSGY